MQGKGVRSAVVAGLSLVLLTGAPASSFAAPSSDGTVTITGTVVDASTKKSLAGIEVIAALRTHPPTQATTTTSAQGTFTLQLSNVPPTGVWITATAPGYQAATAWRRVSPQTPTLTLTLTLSSSARLPDPSPSPSPSPNPSPSPAPWQLMINQDRPRTNTSQVTLTIRLTKGTPAPTRMAFANEGTPWSAPEAFALTKVWQLSAKDGLKTVYASFYDRSNTWVRPINDTIRLDTTPPMGTISINTGALYTMTPTVTLTLAATDNSGVVSQMQFSDDNITYTPAEPYATTKPWTLPSGDGPKTVYVKFADAASPPNWSSPASDAITLDTTSPSGVITSPSDGEVVGAQ